MTLVGRERVDDVKHRLLAESRQRDAVEMRLAQVRLVDITVERFEGSQRMRQVDDHGVRSRLEAPEGKRTGRGGNCDVANGHVFPPPVH